MPVRTSPLSMSMAPSKDYLKGWNDCHKHMAEEIIRQDALLDIARAALEKARPILGFHEHEPWRNEMDKQTGNAASVVRHVLDRLNQ